MEVIPIYAKPLVKGKKWRRRITLCNVGVYRKVEFLEKTDYPLLHEAY